MNHRGKQILMLGILGWVCCSYFTAIPAWIMGKEDLKIMEEGRMNQDGKDMTKIGMILGMVSSIVSTVAIVFLVLKEIL